MIVLLMVSVAIAEKDRPSRRHGGDGGVFGVFGAWETWLGCFEGRRARTYVAFSALRSQETILQ